MLEVLSNARDHQVRVRNPGVENSGGGSNNLVILSVSLLSGPSTQWDQNFLVTSSQELRREAACQQIYSGSDIAEGYKVPLLTLGFACVNSLKVPWFETPS